MGADAAVDVHSVAAKAVLARVRAMVYFILIDVAERSEATVFLFSKATVDEKKPEELVQ